MNFRQFLEIKFLQWQQESGGRRTVREFSKYLGVSQSSVSMWWNGDRVPEGTNVQKLSKKLGLEVYDVLGLPRPDEDLHYLQREWEQLSPTQRRSLREKAETYRRERRNSK